MLLDKTKLKFYGIVQSNFEQWKNDDVGWSDFIDQCNEEAIDDLYYMVGESDYNTYGQTGDKDDECKRKMTKVEVFLTAKYMYDYKAEYIDCMADSMSQDGRSMVKSKYNKQSRRFYFKAMRFLVELGYDVMTAGIVNIDARRLQRGGK
jgi:hypothetical protein